MTANAVVYHAKEIWFISGYIEEEAVIVGFKRARNMERCGGCRIATLRPGPEPTFLQTYTRRTTLTLK
jgi:hypothetical protein